MKGISLFQGVVFGALIVFALIGLLVFATYSNKGGASAVGKVVIWGTLPQAQVDAALAQAVKADQALKDVAYVEKPEESFANDLASAIATGQGPDLVLASQEDLFSLKPFLAPIPLGSLSAGTFTKTFTDGAQIFADPGKGYWGIPLAIDPMVLFYNRSLLASTGVAAPPSTWEALTGLVPTVATYTPTKQVTRGLIALGTYANVHDARGILSTLFLQTDVPMVTEDATGRVSADLGLSSGSNSAGGPPGDAVVRFYTQFIDPNKVSYTWNASLPDSEQAFEDGSLALYLGLASEARFLTAANPNLDFEVAPIPEPATAETKTTYGLIYAAMIPRATANAAGAYKAAALLAGAPEQAALASATGLAPATVGALSAPPAGDATAATTYSSALYAAGWLSPAPASTDQVFGAMINAVVSGTSSIEEALSTAERSLGAALSQ